MTTKNQATAKTANLPAKQTFLDHIHELRSRLFWVAASFIVFSAIAYPFADAIISFLMRPLKGESLVYLTPIGGFGFILKICTYVGIVCTLPVLIYHLFRYLQPLMTKVNRRNILIYILSSTVLALIGVAFSYFVSLPAALNFLTGFGIKDVSAMLTVDAYLSFVTTYLLGAAILFQVPLVLLIIDSIKPLPPGGLMKSQRYVVVVAFIVAAIISPTPDMMNQTILAVPMIAMYQLGIILIWLRSRQRAKKLSKTVQLETPVFKPKSVMMSQPIAEPALVGPRPTNAKTVKSPRFIDGVAPAVPKEAWAASVAVASPRPEPRPAPQLNLPVRPATGLISDVRRLPPIAA